MIMFGLFSVFDLREKRPLSDGERSRIFRIVDKFAMTRYGAFLSAVNYRAIRINWSQAMTPENGVMGAFSLADGEIYLQGDQQDLPMSCWVELMAPTLIHELRHVYQYRKNPLLYILLSLPVIREFTLERDAKNVTETAQKFCDNLMQAEDSYAFTRRYEHGDI